MVLKEELSGSEEIAVENRKKLPSSVDFMLLGSCDLCCFFCFGPQHEIPAMKTDLATGIIHKLTENGVEQIVFTGGEPTLIKDLPDILKVAKERRLKTVLSTNGLLLSSKKGLLAELVPYLDWIALPLEGDSPEVNAAMRVGYVPNVGRRHFEAVLGLIPRIKKEYPSLKIKLGTVVAQPNLDHIVGIPKLSASRQAIPDTWKLYQVSPSEYGKRNYSWLRVPDEKFEHIFQEAKRAAKEVGIANVIKYTNNERPGKYFFIDPKGEVLVIDRDSNDYYSIGNVLRDFQEVTENWQKHVSDDLLTKNFETTYPYPES